MPGFLEGFLHSNAVGMLAVVLGFGYLLGKISIRGFEIGSVSGVLLVGLIFGHFGFELDPTVQSMGFILFIYSVGWQAGPSFFAVIRKDGSKYLALAVVIGLTGFAIAVVLSRVLELEPGASAGVLAGGLTSSPTLAAAQEAVRAGQVPVPEGYTAEQVMTNVSASYAITYIFGLIGLIMIIRILPKIAGVDLPAEAKKLESAGSGGVEDRAVAREQIVVRAYRVENESIHGMTPADAYKKFPGRLTIEKIRREGEFLKVGLDTPLKIGDEITVVGCLEEFAASGTRIGPELSDPALLDIRIESCRVVVIRSRVRKFTTNLNNVVANAGCFVARISRFGVDIPLEGEIEVQAGDVVHLTGPSSRLREVGKAVGHLEEETEKTDLITFAFGIAVGLLVGTLTVSIGGVSVGLGSAGGLIAAGLVVGYLRALHPTFGRVPSAARWLFMELGLLVFMAGVGLRAGSGIIETLAQSGAVLFLSGIAVTVTPIAVGYLFGSKVLRLNPVLLLGGITGSMTSGASLSVVTEEAKSPVPALGYTGAYAFANILLTILGSIILFLA